MTPEQAVAAGRYQPGAPNRGSAFGRSLVTVTNQIPAWGYWTIAAAAIGGAWYAYYSRNKKV
jgi:hypothetical protein